MIEIYGIVENETNDIVYVGQTARGHKKRFLEHRRHKGFDQSQYSVVVLKECSVDELEKWEKHYIAKHDTLSKWNLQEGGKHARGYNIAPRVQSKEEIENRRQSMIENNPLHNAEHRKKKSEVMTHLYSSGKLENPMAKMWLIEYKNGGSERVVSLKKWCRENSYDGNNGYMRLYNGRPVDDIVRATKI